MCSSDLATGASLAVGADGVVVAGGWVGTGDFGSGAVASSGGEDIFVVKVDAQGQHVWSRVLGGVGEDEATTVAVDGSGGVYVGGMYHGTVDFDAGAGVAAQTAVQAGEEAFLVKLDAAGAYVWSKSFGGAADERVQSVAVDRLGDVYAAGYFGGTADLDPGAGQATASSAGGQDAFVVKLTTAGVITLDTQAPRVAAVTRQSPQEGTVSSSAVVYRVRFSREVSGVDAGTSL